MELDDITPEDVYAYIDSSFLPELTFLTIIAFIVSLVYNWPMIKNRFLMEDQNGHLPISADFTRTPRRGRTTKKYRRVTDLRNRRVRSREYILGRPLRQPSYSLIQES